MPKQIAKLVIAVERDDVLGHTAVALEHVDAVPVAPVEWDGVAVDFGAEGKRLVRQKARNVGILLHVAQKIAGLVGVTENETGHCAGFKKHQHREQDGRGAIGDLIAAPGVEEGRKQQCGERG
jgi:hypothetical protein